MQNERNDWLQKYRPKRWTDFYYSINDEPIRSAIDQIKTKQFQNMLLTGDFGLGKTSLARVFGARSQCFEYRQHPYEPCGTCTHCVAAQRGGGGMVNERYHELDASETEFVKKLQAKLRGLRGYSPWTGTEDGLPYIVAVDEFHAVKLEEQTALLKDLEDERNVCFILLTSNDAKVHRAIQSRTVRLDFLPPNKAQFHSWIERICKAEGVTCEAGALEEFRILTNGLPREALKHAQRLTMRSTHWTLQMVRELLRHGKSQSGTTNVTGAGALAY